MHDPILEEVWRVREQLIKEYGGLHGLIKHVQAMDRARLRKARAQRRKHAKKSGNANSTATAASRPTRKKANRVKAGRASRATA